MKKNNFDSYNFCKLLLTAFMIVLIPLSIYETNTKKIYPTIWIEVSYEKYPKSKLIVSKSAEEITFSAYKIDYHDYVEWIPKDGSIITSHMGAKLRLIKGIGKIFQLNENPEKL